MDYYRIQESEWIAWEHIVSEIEQISDWVNTKEFIVHLVSNFAPNEHRNIGILQLAELGYIAGCTFDEIILFLDLFIAIFKSRRFKRSNVLATLLILKIVFDSKATGKKIPLVVANGFCQLLFLISCSPVTSETYICDFRDFDIRTNTSICCKITRKMGFIGHYAYIPNYTIFKIRFGSSITTLFNLAVYLMVDLRYMPFHSFYNSIKGTSFIEQVSYVCNLFTCFNEEYKHVLYRSIEPCIKNAIPLDKLTMRLWRPHIRRSMHSCYSKVYLNSYDRPAYNIITPNVLFPTTLAYDGKARTTTEKNDKRNLFSRSKFTSVSSTASADYDLQDSMSKKNLHREFGKIILE